MKSILIKTSAILFAGAIFFALPNQVTAQYDGWVDQSWGEYFDATTPSYSNIDFVSTSCIGCDTTQSFQPYSSGWVDQSWNDYFQATTPSYPNIDYVSTDCVGCGNYSSSGWVDQSWNDYFQATTPSYPNIDYVSTDCVGCNYTPYTPTNYTYTPYTPTQDYTYTPYTSTNYTYTPYTSTSNYTYTPYTYTPYTSTSNYTYTPYTYTPYTYTPPTTTTSVCSDGLPPVNGSCVRTTTIPVITNSVCTDGQPPVNGSCVRTTTIPVVTNVRCSDGTLPVNGSCTHTTTIPVVTNTICADGQPPFNGSCIRTNTLPVITNTMCSDGLPPVNGSCIRTNTIPTITTNVCSDGTAPHPINGCNRTIITPVTTTQVCWDGSTIPLSSVCPAQYKMCANGTSIPVHQTCYFGSTPAPYTPPTTIKFNNVITSVTTEITNVSARCNGIGLIASNAASTGWFEYGETPNLGRETGKANIGSSPTAPFSNKLVNLKPSTTYYCRAVMQNQYGTVKGEVVAFKTKANAVSYVKPVTKTTVTKTSTTKVVSQKTTAQKNEIVCVDGKVAMAGSKTSAQLINNGEKLVSLQIEKVSGTLSSGSQVSYRLGFKNLSDETLQGMTVKVVLPPEITLVNAQAGQYDPGTRTLTINHPTLAAYGEGSVGWTGVVVKDATVGKSIVTTAYSNYTVPGTDVQDEVTAYTVGSVVSQSDTSGTTTGAKKVIGASSDRGFLPDSLVEWLALIAILFIIFILGRSVYSSYQNDKKPAH